MEFMSRFDVRALQSLSQIRLSMLGVPVAKRTRRKGRTNSTSADDPQNQQNIERQISPNDKTRVETRHNFIHGAVGFRRRVPTHCRTLAKTVGAMMRSRAALMPAALKSISKGVCGRGGMGQAFLRGRSGKPPSCPPTLAFHWTSPYV